MEPIINDLVGYKNFKIVQCKEYFNFSLDSILLPNFVTIRTNCKNIIDLGCGNAPIPLVLSTKTMAKIIGVEVQKEIYKLAKETIKINKKEDQIQIINMNVKDLLEHHKAESFDLVICNPPYFKISNYNKLNDNKIKANARHEILISFDEIVNISSKLLKNKGIFAIIHVTQRLPEILDVVKKYKLEPKRLRFVYSKKNSESNVVLIECVKNANEGLKVLFPLTIHKEDGNYTEEVLNMFE